MNPLKLIAPPMIVATVLHVLIQKSFDLATIAIDLSALLTTLFAVGVVPLTRERTVSGALKIIVTRIILETRFVLATPFTM